MGLEELANSINQYGFPIIAAGFMGYFIYFIWRWVTETIDPILGATMGTLIKLVDRVRMLDNDMIRLNQKLSLVLEYRHQLNQEQNAELDEIIARNASQSESFDSTGETAPEQPKTPLKRRTSR